jgi:hypothetical protein
MGLFRRNSTLRHRYTYLHHMAKTSWNFCLVWHFITLSSRKYTRFPTEKLNCMQAKTWCLDVIYLQKGVARIASTVCRFIKCISCSPTIQ